MGLELILFLFSSKFPFLEQISFQLSVQSLHQYALTTHEGGGGGVFSLIFVTYVFVCATEGRAFDDFFGNYFYWLPGEIPPCQPNQYPHHEGEGGAVPSSHYPANRRALITGNQWQPDKEAKSFTQKDQE